MKNYRSDDIMVEHPKHYQSKSGLEVIQVIEAFTDGLNGIEASDTANIIKYACRWKDKNGIQDLEKIMWYTQHLIKHLREKDLKEGHSEEKEKNPTVRFEYDFTTIDVDNFDTSTITIDKWDNMCTMIIDVNLFYSILDSICYESRLYIMKNIGTSIKIDFEKNLFLIKIHKDILDLIIYSCRQLTPVYDNDNKLSSIKYESIDETCGSTIKIYY